MAALATLGPATRVQRPAPGAGDVHGAREKVGDNGGASKDCHNQRDLEEGGTHGSGIRVKSDGENGQAHTCRTLAHLSPEIAGPKAAPAVCIVVRYGRRKTV